MQYRRNETVKTFMASELVSRGLDGARHRKLICPKRIIHFREL